MAQRRMFALCVVNQPRFIRLQPTARCAFFELCMAADDDGFVEAFNVMRLTGANEDDLQALQRIDYLRVLNDDFLCWIPVWAASNKIPPDRYKPSIYHSALADLAAGREIEVNFLDSCTLSTSCQQNVDKLDTQYRSGQSMSAKSSSIQDKGQSISGQGDGDASQTRFATALRDMLCARFGFRAESAASLKSWVFNHGIDAEVIAWIACKAADADYPRSYFAKTITDKCIAQNCKSKEDLLRLEPGDSDIITDIAKQIDAIRSAIDDEMPY